jgi:putative DNA methylase
VASRAAVLGALLPAWEGNEELLRRHFADEAAYHAWFKRMLGILGDPIAAQQAQLWARARGVRLPENPFGYARAFSTEVEGHLLVTLRTILGTYLGEELPTLLDPMAGGGSIPFEALRMGLRVLANELNPVAAVILKATLEYPHQFGQALVDDLVRWGSVIDDFGRRHLAPFFPSNDKEEILDYLWARTVPCPATGKPVPLSPNWWLRRPSSDDEEAVAVRLLADPAWDQCRFEIVRGPKGRLEERYAPDRGTVRRGNAVSPWTGDPIPGDYIKRCAQEGKMDAQLYALCVDRGAGRDFRLPNEQDLEGVRRAEEALRHRWGEWLEMGLIPTEEVPPGHKTDEARRYGMDRWYKLFSPRQLLALVTYLEALRELAPQMERELGREKAAAVRTYLALVLDKAADHNNFMSRWESTRTVIKAQTDRHDFSFKWSFAEMNMALKDRGGFPWALSQVVEAYQGLCELLAPSRPLFPAASPSPPATVTLANAASLHGLADASVDAVVVDPPYGNNVMYAELSDFFYVWLKRSVGDLYPEWFRTELTDKHAEAVANPALFRGQRGDALELATRDYLLKMRRAFREMRRVVKPKGAMVVMFTHRETAMWNALGLALLETGWEVGSSWPVHTESEHSLHQARKNAARSTILLFCRPRLEEREPSYWDATLQQEVRATARRKAQEYQRYGVEGVDLYLATFGPVLGVLSRHWPILSAEVDRRTGEPRPLEPEAALSIARREVFALRKEQMLAGRPASWDAASEWYILAWDAFRAREFPFDEARKLALSAGLEVADLLGRDRLLARKGDTVRFLEPRERLGDNHVNPKRASFPRLVDGLHTAMWLYQEEGEPACRRFLEQTGYLRDPDFVALFQAAVKVIPRTQRYNRGRPVGFLLPEAAALEGMRITFFPDIHVPPEPLDAGAEQGRFEDMEEEEEE